MKSSDDFTNEVVSITNIDDITKSIDDESDLTVIPISLVNKRNLDYLPEDYQKRGFNAAILEKQNHFTILNNLINEVEKQHERIIVEIAEFYALRKQHYIERISILNKRIEEIESKKLFYENFLSQLSTEKKGIEHELIRLQDALESTLKNVGLAKHQLIENRMDDIQFELDSLMTIHHKAEDKQNSRFTDKNKALNQDRINFLTTIKKEYQNSFDSVNLRIKGFDKTGISLVLANTLVSIGFLGTLIAGWFFSIWTGPRPVQNDLGNIVNNSSVLFFLLKELTRFTLRYSRTELLVGILAFFSIMFLVSWGCYKMLIYFGFVASPIQEISQKANETEFELDFSNQDDFFKSQLKGSNWFSFWLKLTPFLIFVFIILAVLGRVSLQPEDQFQNMFDSLVNQNFGSMLCVVVSGLIYLYVIKIIEPRHITYKESDEYIQNETASKNWELIATFILFILLLIAFLTSYSWLSLFIDTRKLFLIAFFITTINAGFCLSYGLRFRELISTYDMLERHLYKLTELIYRISKPISYLENQGFQERISDLQDKMMRMIEKRNSVALFLIDNKEEPTDQGQSPALDDIILTPVRVGRQLLQFIWRTSAPIRKWFMTKLRKKIDKIIDKDEVFSEEERIYFPELVAEVDELKKGINKRIKHLEQIDKQQDDYWRDQGLYKSIQQQLANRRKRIVELKDILEEDLINQQNELNRINIISSKQKDLLMEGFNTGLWYLKNGDDLRDMYLIN
jgi:hypothetical protein